MIVSVIEKLLLAYIRYFPNHLGKWRVSQWLFTRIRDITVEARTTDGFIMQLNTEDFIQRSIFLTGHWDEEVAQVIRNTLRKGDTFIDVGANVGYFSLLASQICKKVICFEPNPACIKQLTINIKLNKISNIDVRKIGLADNRRITNFNIEDCRNVGGGSLRNGEGKSFTIQLDTLDNELPKITPRLIKIDIEGAELLALKGGKKMLEKSDAPDVICEISEFSLERLGTSKKELFHLMENYGYKYRIISPIRQSNLAELPYFQYDVLFYKEQFQ